MIRLIASDMDGTLLDEHVHVPPETFELIDELASVGVRFCVSSGRAYTTLIEMFAPVVDKIDFICSNGAEIHVQGTCIVKERFSTSAMLEIAQLVNMFDAHHFVSDGERYLAYDDSQEKFERLQSATNEDVSAFVRDLPRPGEHIQTAWVISERFTDINDLAYILNLEVGDRFTFNCTSVGMDLSVKGINKGAALRRVMRHYGIEADEVMAYGDSMNDYEMLREVGHPVVMANAFYVPKQLAQRIIESNVEHGVQRDMRRVIEDIRAGGTGVPSFGAR